MPPLLDSDAALAPDAALAQALVGAHPGARARLSAELATVRARGAASGASAEQVRLAEALLLALTRPPRVEP